MVLEWQHQGCDSDLSADFLNFGAGDFLFQFPFKKCFKIGTEVAWCCGFAQDLQYKVLGRASCKLCSTKCYWEVLCASFVVQSSTGTCFVQALCCVQEL